MKKIISSRAFYNSLYKKLGVDAQRKYPNEELMRFMGRNFFNIKKEKRKKIKILETGCGSGGNLGMLIKEGFNTYGIDNSETGIKICEKNLKSQKLKAKLIVDNMESMSFLNKKFNAVIDIFSSCCLDQKSGLKYLSETSRVLKKNGLFFTYFPSKKSDTWKKQLNQKNFKKQLIDNYTLKGIFRKSAPYYGNNYSLRFLSVKDYLKILKKFNFKIQYSEITSRTYRFGKEYFEFIVIEAKKI